MKDTTPYEVYYKITGNIRPVGETNHDNKTNINLDQFLFNMQCLIEEASEVMSVPYYGEESIREAKEKVITYFKTAIEYMQDVIKDEFEVRDGDSNDH